MLLILNYRQMDGAPGKIVAINTNDVSFMSPYAPDGTRIVLNGASSAVIVYQELETITQAYPASDVLSEIAIES